jgi:hypothetical protein
VNQERRQCPAKRFAGAVETRLYSAGVNTCNLRDLFQRQFLKREHDDRLALQAGELPWLGFSPMTVFDPQVHIAMLERELQWAHVKIQVLEERLRQRRVQVLGPQSETLSDLQLELLAEVEPSATGEEVEAEARREPLPQKPAPERKRHPGRRSLPENEPRMEQVVGVQGRTAGGAVRKPRSSVTTKAKRWTSNRRVTSCG